MGRRKALAGWVSGLTSVLLAVTAFLTPELAQAIESNPAPTSTSLPASPISASSSPSDPSTADPTPSPSATPAPTTTAPPVATPTPTPAMSPRPSSRVSVLVGEPVNTLAPVITIPAASGVTVGGVLAPKVSTTTTASTITVNSGTWTPTGTTYTYAWFQCTSASSAPTDALPDGCSQISSATTSSLTLAAAYAGKYLVARVTAKNPTTLATTDKVTKSTLQVRLVPSIGATNPSITSDNIGQQGVAHTAIDGVWNGFSAPTFAYVWYACTTAVTTSSSTAPATTNCVAISGATSKTFTPTATQVGRYLLVKVTATNDAQTVGVARFSATTAKKVAAIPVNTVAPVLTTNPATNPPTVGGTVSTNTGTWTGTATIAYTYQWYRCDSPSVTATNTLPDGCAAIATSATAASYTVQNDDVASGQKYLLARVRATNTVGYTDIFSATKGPAVKAATRVSNPEITGENQASQTLTATSGEWTGGVPAPTFTYEWYKCTALVAAATDTKPTNCGATPLKAASSDNTYVTVAGDVGGYIVVKVIPANGAAMTPRFSASTPVISSPPANLTPPSYVVNGGVNTTTPKVGGTVAVTATSQGTWSGTPAPSGRTYQWYVCTSAVSSSNTQQDGCDPVSASDGTSATLSVIAAYTGQYLVVSETVSNTKGSATKWSAASAPVNQAPAFSQDPAVSGTAIDGYSVYVTNVDNPIGYPQPAKSYLWYRCTSPLVNAVAAPATTPPTGCTAITDGTGGASTYNVVYADAGKYLSVRVGLTNAANTTGTFKWSATTDAVTSQAKNTSRPTTSVAGGTAAGAPKVGGTVTTNGGQWQGVPTVDKAYQWFECTGAHNEVLTDVPGDCSAITASSLNPQSATLTVGSGQVQRYLLVRVTGSNVGFGPTDAYSQTTAQTERAPTVTTSPQLVTNPDDADRRYVGQALGAQSGEYDLGFPEATSTVTWLRCTAAVGTEQSTRPSTCSPISGVPLNQPYYQTVLADAGAWITFEEKVTNSAGSVVRIPAVIRATASLPANTFKPAVTGNAWVGNSLTATDGTWTGLPSVSKTRQWMVCSSAYTTAPSSSPSDCADIPGATGSSLALSTEDMAGKYYLVAVTGTTDAGSVVAWSPSVGPIKIKPTVVDPPMILELTDDTTNSGITGYTHKSSPGTWTGTEPLSAPAYKWYLCTSRLVNAVTGPSTNVPAGCTAITTAVTSTYTPVTADAGKYLSVSVTRTNGTESITSWSATTTAPLVTAIPAPTVAPSVTITAGASTTQPKITQPGATTSSSVTAANGTWSTTTGATIAFRYEWYRCDTAVATSGVTPPAASAGCVAVTDVTSQVFALTRERPELIGKYLLAKVTAYHPGTPKNTRVHYTVSTTGTVQSAPWVKSDSSVSGTNYVLATLTADPGTAYGLPSPSVAYQWLRCTAPITTPIRGLAADRPGTCSPISGATTASYTLADADFGQYIAVSIKWTNTLDTTGAVSYSMTTPQVVRGPVAIAPPTISTTSSTGQIVVGVGATVADGTWKPDGEQSRSYQWYRCTSTSAAADTKPSSCVSIDEARTSSYVPLSTGDSSTTDEGKYLVVAVTSTNSEGTATKYSASSTQVTSVPANTQAPTISGRPFVGTPLAAGNGTWTGTPSPTYSAVWFACPSSNDAAATVGSDCQAISGATTASFTPTAAQIGQYLQVRIRAVNVAGEAYFVSATTAAITEGPYNRTAPSVSGTTKVGAAAPMQATLGGWGGNPYPDVRGQWLRCDGQIVTALDYVDTAELSPYSCVLIDGATNPTYMLTADDRGKFMAYAETAENTYGLSEKVSASTSSRVLMDPTPTENPYITGAPEAGSSTPLHANPGTWIGYPAVTTTARYAWFRCSSPVNLAADTLPSQCWGTATSASAATPIATTQDYAPSASTDLGKYLVVRVGRTSDGTNFFYKVSASTGAVTNPPSATGTPVINGGTRMNASAKPVPVTGKSLTVTPATWTNVTGGITHRWFRCSASVTVAPLVIDDSVCVVSDSADALADTYNVTAADIGSYLLVEESATNSAGTKSKYSTSTLIVQELPNWTTAPAVSGTRTAGSTLTADNVDPAGWTGTATVTIDVAWYTCVNAVTNPATLPSDAANNCTRLTASSGLPANQYRVTSTDAAAGSMITAFVTAMNPATEATTPAQRTTYLVPVSTADKIVSAPTNSVSPTVSLVSGSAPEVGSSYQANEGTWTGSPTYTYSWFACSALVTASSSPPNASVCDTVPDQNGKQLLLTSGMLGKYMLAGVTATNAAGTSTAYSASATQPVREGVYYSAAPSVSPRDSRLFGSTLTVDLGTWVGLTAGDKIDFKWSKCSRLMTDPIDSGTTSLNCGDVSSLNTATWVIDPVSQVGAWTLTAGSTYDFTTTSGQSGKYVASFVRLTHYLDAGKTLYTLRSLYTASTGMVLEVPSVTTAPSVAGTNTVGQTLTRALGTWRGAAAPTYSTAWYRCVSAVTGTAPGVVPADCSVIDGQTGPSYTLVDADREKFIGVFVTASNASGSATSFSLTTAAIRTIPVNQVAPVVSTSRPVVGQAFTTSLGTWDGFPAPTFAVTWYTCSAPVAETSTSLSPSVCTSFATDTLGSAAIEATTTVPAGSAQRYIAVKVRAVNAAGGTDKTSITSSQIWEIPNTGAVKPSMSGTANVGEVLSPVDGNWNAFPAPTATDYAWYRCPSPVTSASGSLTGCGSPVSTGLTYTLTSADTNKYVVVRVIKTNDAGIGWYYSASTVKVLEAPSATSGPSVSATDNQVGQPFTVNDGAWRGEPTPATPTYQWYACSASIDAPLNDVPGGSTCAIISGATSATFTPTSAQAGKYVSALVTRTNNINATGLVNYTTTLPTPATKTGTGKKFSTSAFVRQPPQASSAPALSGAANVGSTLSMTPPTWTGDFPAKTSTGFLWYSCPTTAVLVSDCDPMPDTTASIVVPVAFSGKNMGGRQVWGVAWAENSAGRTNSSPAKTMTLSEAPVVLTAPSLVSSQPQTGQSITVTAGTYRSTAGANASPASARTLAYAWYSCPASDSVVGDCRSVGTNSTSYSPVGTDRGRYILVVESATNSINTTAQGTTVVTSSPTTNASAVKGPVYDVPTATGTATLGSGAVPVGTELSVTGDTWVGYPDVTSKKYEWYACTSAVTTAPASTTIPTGCAVISGATLSTFTTTVNQGDKHIIARVAATNAAGTSSWQWTVSRGAVTMAPVNKVAPTVTGTPQVGSTLTRTVGTSDWQAFPAVNATSGYAWRWLACGSIYTAPAPSSQPGDCVEISGQTTKTLAITAAMNIAGKYVMLEEKATNSSGSTYAYSVTTSVVRQAPTAGAVAVLTGDALVGSQLAVTGDTYGGYPDITSRLYSWYQCTGPVSRPADNAAMPSTCTLIAGAGSLTASTFDLTATQAGAYVIAKVVASNGVGSAITRWTQSVGPIATPTP